MYRSQGYTVLILYQHIPNGHDPIFGRSQACCNWKLLPGQVCPCHWPYHTALYPRMPCGSCLQGIGILGVEKCNVANDSGHRPMGDVTSGG